MPKVIKPPQNQLPSMGNGAKLVVIWQFSSLRARQANNYCTTVAHDALNTFLDLISLRTAHDVASVIRDCVVCVAIVAVKELILPLKS